MFDVTDFIMEEQVSCLTEAIYHEARGEDFIGQILVGFVIKNRVKSDKFPNDFCQVIEQPWQFSFVHELDTTTMYEEDARDYAEDIAHIVINSYSPLPNGVLYYHADHMTPNWDFNKLDLYKHHGNHIFYEEL